MEKLNNIYKERLQLGAYYTYDKNNKKVYDIKGMREAFKKLINKLKQISVEEYHSVLQKYHTLFDTFHAE